MEILNYWFCLLSIQHFPFKDHAVILGKKDKKNLHMSRILMHLLRFECIAVKWKEHVPSLKCMNISRGRNHDIKNLSSFNIWITTLKSIHWVNSSARSSFFEKGIILTKPFQPSQSWHQLSFFEKGIIVQNFLLSEWALAIGFFIKHTFKISNSFMAYGKRINVT